MRGWRKSACIRAKWDLEGEGVASIEEWMVAAMNAQLSKLSFQDLQVDVEGREGVAPSGRGEGRARGSRAISIGQNVG